MDPDLAYSTMVDEKVPMTTRNEAAQDLNAWLMAGGFPPAGKTRAEALRAVREHWREVGRVLKR